MLCPVLCPSAPGQQNQAAALMAFTAHQPHRGYAGIQSLASKMRTRGTKMKELQLAAAQRGVLGLTGTQGCLQ